MTPPIGFRTSKDDGPKGPVAAIRPTPVVANATAPATTTISDYAYRIAALTAGIALLASIW